ncbi:hypothetical protein SDC9_170427 [bioreactor metagenome]|uniref:Uncharacterized protein n=1 Tax=bioreactor metagenome TaxID=1076179 RepID=A0A645GAN7_9ZZZZ
MALGLISLELVLVIIILLIGKIPEEMFQLNFMITIMSILRANKALFQIIVLISGHVNGDGHGFLQQWEVVIKTQDIQE